ncbi:hypothetical protein BN970_04605 [Mycolicibacterium conceptionense]|uniref:Uncharacterized protein n=1 Tax=Mycolicibacterium conceptionense TaxID=451644 RepID=A0A0U1DS58_9MYCO|nr:hypothetical protein [Mycolicibacterium conceptionense]ORV25531.1 hypothetical protein AWB98_18055 [Mycolicibacterium conceptionense]CQD20045.1 hypothetical protein BN970_04605 [Mycolicibacterium conceptionense]
MAKILGTFAAISRYQLKRLFDSQLDPAVPDKFERLHACRLPEDEPWPKLYEVIADAREPVFATYPSDGIPSACGHTMKVFLPQPFDSDHPKACPDCIQALSEAE